MPRHVRAPGRTQKIASKRGSEDVVDKAQVHHPLAQVDAPLGDDLARSIRGAEPQRHHLQEEDGRRVVGRQQRASGGWDRPAPAWSAAREGAARGNRLLLPAEGGPAEHADDAHLPGDQDRRARLRSRTLTCEVARQEPPSCPLVFARGSGPRWPCPLPISQQSRAAVLRKTGVLRVHAYSRRHSMAASFLRVTALRVGVLRAAWRRGWAAGT